MHTYFLKLAVLILLLVVIAILTSNNNQSTDELTISSQTVNVDTKSILKVEQWDNATPQVHWNNHQLPETAVPIDWNKNIGPVQLFNLSVRKTSSGFVGLVRGATARFSYPYSITLDNDSNVKDLTRLPFDYNQFTQCHTYAGTMELNGIEDPRSFVYMGEEWGIANVIGSNEQHYACINTMAVFKVSDIDNSFNLLYPPDSINLHQLQKNWSPFEWMAPDRSVNLYCEYSLNPHVIFQIDPFTGKTTEIAQSTLPDSFLPTCDIKNGLSLRGGAPPIFINMGHSQFYLGIGHTRRPNPADYLHFFYQFENTYPFKITALTKPFKFEGNERIQFAAGLSIDPSFETVSGDTNLYVSYGVSDDRNKISIFKLSDILDLLISVDTTQE